MRFRRCGVPISISRVLEVLGQERFGIDVLCNELVILDDDEFVDELEVGVKVSEVPVSASDSFQRLWFEKRDRRCISDSSTGLSGYVITLVAPWRLSRNDIGTNR